MRNKLVLVHLSLGLVFLLSVLALGETDPPSGVPGDLDGPYDLATGLKKGQPLPTVEKVLEPVEPQSLPLGKTAEICDDYRWRDPGACYWWPGALFPGAIYLTYQDPTAACVSPPYTFNVQTATFWFNSGGDPPASEGSAVLQAMVYDVDYTDPACPCPGNLIRLGPSFSVNIQDGYNMISLPLADDPYDIFCTDEPYFIAITCLNHDPTLSLGPLLTCELVGPQYCTWYTNINADPAAPCPWNDLAAAFEGPPGESLDLFLWSTGVTGDENYCDLPSDCDWDWQHCVWNTQSFYEFSLPSISGYRDEIYQVWQSALPCTIMTVAQYLGNTIVKAGDPGLRVSIWLDNNYDGKPETELAGEDRATGDLTAGFNIFTFHDDQPVVVPPGAYFIMVSRASWAGDGDTVYVGLDDHDNPSLCDNLCATHMIAGDAIGNVHTSICDYYGLSYELFAEVYTCCPYHPGCHPKVSVPDDWRTHAHDYARTSRSTMAVGEYPCNINLAWAQTTVRADARFNNVTAAGGRVYCSDDRAIHCFDLATGSLLWIYSAAGITGSSMRNNLTVQNGFVYGSGGTARSFFKLDTLGALQWSRPGAMGGALGWDQRFSVSVVVDDKIIVGDEVGYLWCLDEATGGNHPAWGTNPIDLGGAIYHSPAYDGGAYLYVANLSGRIWRVNLADGTASMIFAEPDNDGFYCGCSYDVDEDVIYTASHDGTGGGDTPERFKIATDGSGAVWSHPQGNVLYSPPTIGDRNVYFAQDYPAAGVLVVNKNTGLADYDFAVDGVGQVSNPVTMTCDCRLFAGDRQGGWHLLDFQSMTRIWSRYFQDFVWGTALIHHDLENKDYAVMSIWSDITMGYAYGGVYCWELNAAPRPMLEQLVDEINIQVPLGTGTGLSEAAGELFMNIGGCADLNVGPINVYDNDPPSVTDLQARITTGETKSARVAAETADKLAGDNYLSFFDDQGNLTKRGMAAGISKDDNIETFNRALNKRLFEQGKNRTSNLAAGAQTVRTSNVALDVATPISGATTFGITWDYDGSGLARAISSDILEFVNDDPDFYPELAGMGYYPTVTINYIGGCLFEWFESMYFNGYEMWHLEAVHNAERIADGTVPGLDWGDYLNDDPEFDASPFLCDADPADGQMFQWTTQHGGTGNSDAVRYLPNPAPMSGTCGIDYADYVPLGRSVVMDWNAGGNCPPQLGVDYLDVEGEVTWASYVDTIAGDPIDFTYGTEWTRVEIAAYDFGHGYGDFKLYHYKCTNRDDVAKDNLIFGMFTDWDVLAYNSNAGVIDGDAGGYAIWDSVNSEVAFGWLAVGATPSLANSGEVDATGAYKYLEVAYNNYRIYSGGPGFGAFDTEAHACAFVDTSYGTFYTPGEPTNNPGDRCGILIMPRFDLAPYGEHHIYLALFGVDATSNDHAAIQENIRKMAYRVNKWAGFCRGDVNDDNEVNAIDVAYLHAVVTGSLPHVFPWNGNGDVNLSGFVDPPDIVYLLDYLMGGPTPLGEWRFDFMP